MTQSPSHLHCKGRSEQRNEESSSSASAVVRKVGGAVRASHANLKCAAPCETESPRLQWCSAGTGWQIEWKPRRNHCSAAELSVNRRREPAGAARTDASWRSVSAHQHRSRKCRGAFSPWGTLQSRIFKYPIFWSAHACFFFSAGFPVALTRRPRVTQRLCAASILISGPGDPPHSKT